MREKKKNNGRNMYLTPAHEVRVCGQHIDHLSFALVAPLSAQHHGHLVGDGRRPFGLNPVYGHGLGASRRRGGCRCGGEVTVTTAVKKDRFSKDEKNGVAKNDKATTNDDEMKNNRRDKEKQNYGRG